MQMTRPLILFSATIVFSITAVSTVNRHMTHYDLTKDWKVDRRELRTVAYMDHKLPPTISDDIFGKADRNGDKFIDRTEIIAAARLIQRHVAQATLHWLEDHDTDGDGLLNEVEIFESIYMELGLSMIDVNGCFRKSDVNKDRYLTSSELIEMLHCSRLLALKEMKELLKIYDTDGDHRLNKHEALILASLRYDVEPGYATIVFDNVSHRADHKINELELIDFLTKLREEAAIAALNKLSVLDQNGDEAVSFNELLRGYERQLKKPVLKKIFSKVDVNKNAHIDPIEFVSLQNLIADETRLQRMQNDFDQQYSATVNATTSLPTLVIFRLPKKPHNKQRPRQRKRRSDSETDKKLMVSDESHPAIRELTAINASSVHFSTVATVVPKFMKSNDEYQKFLSSGAKLISEMFTINKRMENRDVVGRNDIKQTRENLISDKNAPSLISKMMQKNRKFMPVIKDQSETNSGNDVSGYVRNQNEAFTDSPSVAYFKKFGKFFDFLQKAIKKISKAIKENSKKQEKELKSPLRGINVIKHSSGIADNTSNIEASEIKKIANNSENSVSMTTIPEKLEIQRNLSEEVYDKIRDEKDFIVYTPIDSTESKTVVAKKFNELFDTAFLQLDEKETTEEAKMTNYERKEGERSLDEHKFHDELEKSEEESGVEHDCILEDQVNSSNSTDYSEHSSKPVKRYKCNIKARTSNEANTKPLQETPNKFKKNLFSQDKSLNKTDSVGNETILPLLQNVANEDSLLKKEDKPSSVSYNLPFEHHKVEDNETIPETEDDQESEKKTLKYVNLNESLEHETKDSVKALNDILNTTFSSVDQASMISETENHRKKDSQDDTKLLFRLKKNDTISRISKISMTSPAPLMISSTFMSSSKKLSSATTNPKLLTKLNHENDEAISFLTNHENEQESRMQANSRTVAETGSEEINQTSITDLQNNNLNNAKIVEALSNIIINLEENGEIKIIKQHNEDVSSIQKERKKCSNHRHGCQQKSSNEDNISAEINVPVTSAASVICSKERKLGKKYRSKICSKFLSRSIETSENIDSFEEDFPRKNETESLHKVTQSRSEAWQTGKIEDLLLQALQEYHTYLRNQGKRTWKINK